MKTTAGNRGEQAVKTLRDILANQPTMVGTFCTLGVEVVELACHCGMDFVLIDGQHGSFDVAGLRHALRAADAAGCYPIARLPAQGGMLIEPLLDAGYMTLIAPMVNSAEDAARLVDAAHYPPMGQRSQSGCRAATRQGADYRDRFNERFTLLVMIEHMRAVEQIDAILAVPGVAGCFIGPTDLASSLPGEGSAKRQALDIAIERVRSATAAAGKIVGITAASAEEARLLSRRGFQVITISVDRKLLMDNLTRINGEWRKGHVDGVRA